MLHTFLKHSKLIINNNTQMKQIFENLLADFKKANKERKQKLAEKNGFKTADEYQMYLSKALLAAEITPIVKEMVEEVKKETKKTSGKKAPKKVEIPTIHNVHILDESGSMTGSKYANALKGINEEVDKLKTDKTINYTQTLVGFSGHNQIVEYSFMKPVSEVFRFTGETKGSTALHDAVGQTLTKLLKKANGKDKFIVTIFTDGGENNSRKFTAYHVAELIKKSEEKGFTITFIGTKHKLANITRLYNLDEGNTLVHDNTASGIAASYQTRSVAMDSFAEDVKLKKDVSKGFFKKVGKL